MFHLSHFFGTQICPPLSYTEMGDTICRVPEKTDKGVVMVCKSLELGIDPNVLVDYSDFSLDRLIEAGITPKSITTHPDYRIGSDERVVAFLDKLETNLLNSKED